MNFLYLVYDADDELLYVGISSSIGSRVSQHDSQTGWWGEARRIELEPVEGDRSDLIRVEAERIRALHPKHNVAHNIRRPVAEPGKRGRPAGEALDNLAIKRRMKSLGLTGVALAQRADLSTSHLSMARTGKRGASTETVAAIAAALECSPSDIITPKRAAA